MKKIIEVTPENIKNGTDFYIPLGIIPDYMGINLCNVKQIEVESEMKGDTEEMHSLKIVFKN